jgi:uncharacterized protein (TIGR02611 family)
MDGVVMSDSEHRLSDHESFEDKVEHIAEEIVDEVEGAIEASLPLPIHLRMRAWAERRPVTYAVWRAAVLIVGLSVLGAGIAMLVLPGPGWAAIFLGLVILASEFAWAHRLAVPLKNIFNKALERARRKGKKV